MCLSVTGYHKGNYSLAYQNRFSAARCRCIHYYMGGSCKFSIYLICVYDDILFCILAK